MTARKVSMLAKRANHKTYRQLGYLQCSNVGDWSFGLIQVLCQLVAGLGYIIKQPTTFLSLDKKFVTVSRLAVG